MTKELLDTFIQHDPKGEETALDSMVARLLIVWASSVAVACLGVSVFHFLRGTYMTGAFLIGIALVNGVLLLLRRRIGVSLLVDVSVFLVGLLVYGATLYAASTGSRGGATSVSMAMLVPLFTVLAAVTAQRLYQFVATTAFGLGALVFWLEVCSFPAIVESLNLYRVIAYPAAAVMTVLACFVYVAFGRVRVLTARVRDSERKYRGIFENVVDPVILHRFDGTIIDVNQAACAAYGFTREKLVGSAIDRLANESRKRREAALASLADGSKKAHIVRTAHRRLDGTVFPVELRVGTVEPASESCFVAVARDLTEQDRREQRIAFQAEVLDTVAQSIIVLDRYGNAVYANRKAAKLAGIEPSQLRGMNAAGSIVVPAHRSRLQEALECAGNGGTWHGEVHVRDAAGSEVPTILNVAPVDMEGTAVRHVALLFVDITAQKQLEAELREASVEARQAVKAKSAFLANMSHEIRTPLNGIIGFADLLLADDPRDDQKEALAHLHAAGRSLMTVLDDVLDISKLEAGRYDLHPASFDVEELLEGIEALYYRDAKAKGLALTFTRDPALPRCLYADPDRIRQILGNLVSNAIKYTETGSVTVSVALADEAPPDGDESSLRLRFDVRDTGIGIAAQNQNRVFDIFEQLNQSRRRRIAGTGLGLAICKRLVESMDGRIWVESEPGVGSVFSCAISVGIGFDDASLVAGESVLSADAEGSRTLHILIADDDRVSAIVATRLLESGGHTVDTATTGVEAVRAVRTRSFDLVFMDVQMPEMDGLTATAEIRRSVGSQLPIVGLSASAVGEERAAMLAAGMDAVLAKPVTKETLLATANRATENRPTADHSAADQSARSRPARDQSAAQER